jgi:predicted transcriptional regulator
MKAITLTIRLDKDLDDLLTKVSRRCGKNRSEIAREALRRQFRAWELDASRQRKASRAKTRGYLTAEDVADEV